SSRCSHKLILCGLRQGPEIGADRVEHRGRANVEPVPGPSNTVPATKECARCLCLSGPTALERDGRGDETSDRAFDSARKHSADQYWRPGPRQGTFMPSIRQIRSTRSSATHTLRPISPFNFRLKQRRAVTAMLTIGGILLFLGASFFRTQVLHNDD